VNVKKSLTFQPSICPGQAIHADILIFIVMLGVSVAVAAYESSKTRNPHPFFSVTPDDASSGHTTT
jgi:hypothetical protein